MEGAAGGAFLVVHGLATLKTEGLPEAIQKPVGICDAINSDFACGTERT